MNTSELVLISGRKLMAFFLDFSVGRHGRYWYLGDWVLPQVQHVYPFTTISIPYCLFVRLVDLLTDEEIA